MNELQRRRLRDAWEAHAEALAVREAGMDPAFVLNNLYLSFYYPVTALVYEGQVPDVMQSVTIGLFEQRFVHTGAVDSVFLDGVRRLFELKPKCSGGCPPVTPEEIDRLADQARSFIMAVQSLLDGP